MSNKTKSEQLGMNASTAYARLRKMIMFQLIKETNKDICYHCGEKIENVEDLSIEHKEKWLYSDNPADLFFDLDNIAFSHLSCNIKDSRPGIKPAGISGERYIHYDSNPRLVSNWRVAIFIDGVRNFVGGYKTKEEAIIARDKFLKSKGISSSV